LIINKRWKQDYDKQHTSMTQIVFKGEENPNGHRTIFESGDIE